MRYILRDAMLLGACDVTQYGGHLGRHLGFYPKLELVKTRQKLAFFDARHVEYDKLKHLTPFVKRLCFYHLKMVKTRIFTQTMA